MKTKKFLSIVFFAFFLASCSSVTKFPVSNAVPAADITVKKKQDKNNNFLIEVTAVNLAEASRLNPPKNNYSVWIVTDNGSTKNIGQLQNQNAKKAVLKAVTPFTVSEVFITAEDHGDLVYPSGTEISRTSIK
jgi:PBP1b-binding outer membrane lipoprotein LpoB